MPRRPAVLAILSATLAFSACGSPMDTPAIKKNPHPSRRYEITITIEGAPGPFDSAKADVLLQVKNDECYPLQPGSGARFAPEKRIPVELSGSGNTYKGSFYEDQLLDENYFGMGVCHWGINIVGAYLSAGKASFDTSLSTEDLHSGRPNTTYYRVKSYHNQNQIFPDSGSPRTEDVVKNPGDYFSITVTGKEASP